MRVLRNLLLLLFLLGLVAFNVSFGLRRFEWRREAWITAQREAGAARLADLASILEREFAALEAEARLRLGEPAAAELRGEPGDPRAGARWRVDEDGALRLAWCLDPGAAASCVEGRSAWLAQRAATAAALGARIAWLGGEAPVGDTLDASNTLPANTTSAGSAQQPTNELRRNLAGVGDSRLVLQFEAQTLEPPSDWQRAETVATVATMLGVSLGLLFAGAVFLRLSTRSFRLRETERYLRWIRRLSDRYRALMEGAADMILIVDPSSEHLRESNAVARAVLGLPAGADAPGVEPSSAPRPEHAIQLAELFSGDDLQRVREALGRAAQTGQAPEALPELHVHARDREDLLVDGRVAVVDVGDGHIAQLSLRDLSEQKAIERQLQTSERLSSLGLLTAGVAHEINNPLEGIGNYLSLLRADDLSAERRREHLGSVQHGFERIRDIVRDLLQFSRGEAQRGPIDLSEVLQRALSMAAYSKAFKSVRVIFEGAEQACPVLGDAGRLEQVLLNLLLNAARASAAAAEAAQEPARVWVRLSRSDEGAGQVQLEVADEGRGIPPEHLERIFDPFFTTEGGTGLGLSVSYGIIKAHGGELRAQNRAEGGAAFLLTLPQQEVSA
ncbi:MAG: hypothetical protein DHS20C15_26680 [Planctomycetota bacterium]|nr:MAG: hypothetical protein DHS20C15_26680 [Planctomycetota bacterium]